MKGEKERGECEIKKQELDRNRRKGRGGGGRRGGGVEEEEVLRK